MIYLCKFYKPIFSVTDIFVSAGAGFSYVPKVKTRMIMSEKPNDGTVVMFHGEIEDGDFLAAEDHLPTLPNTVSFIVNVTLSH